jgi:heme/copper-type cytochrome/quinol oxidase subunit 2
MIVHSYWHLFMWLVAAAIVGLVCTKMDNFAAKLKRPTNTASRLRYWLLRVTLQLTMTGLCIVLFLLAPFSFSGQDSNCHSETDSRGTYRECS